MSDDLIYKPIIWLEMKPDIYAGENCNELKPRFECFSDGDMDSDYVESIKFAATTFPPGTKIFVEVPCCPNCCQEADMCLADENCDFDWNEWCYGKYS